MSSDQLGQAYRTVTRPASRRDCPGSSQLVDFAAGPHQSAELADHLGNCSACAEEFLALRAVAPTPMRVAAAPVSLAWPLSVAALLVLTAGLGAAMWSLRERNRDLTRAASMPVVRSAPPAIQPSAPSSDREPLPPQPNVSVIDLLPASAMVRGGGITSAAVPKDARDLTLILNLEGGAAFPGYALEIVDIRGKVAWTTHGLKRSPQDTFTLHLTRAFFSPDRYELRLYGVRGEERTRIESYALDLRASGK